MINDRYDEKFALKTSLQIMQEMREILINDTINIKPELHTGLHKSYNTAVRDLYIESYLVLWLYKHWEQLDAVLEKHDEYSKDSRKNITLYFGRFFAEFIDSSTKDNYLAALSIPVLLKSKSAALKEMQILNKKWEEISNKFKLEIIKDEENYKELIKKYESEEN